MLSVFIAGLMVGRTPEYLGKKIEPREMKLISLYILLTPALGPGVWRRIALLHPVGESVDPERRARTG